MVFLFLAIYFIILLASYLGVAQSVEPLMAGFIYCSNCSLLIYWAPNGGDRVTYWNTPCRHGYKECLDLMGHNHIESGCTTRFLDKHILYLRVTFFSDDHRYPCQSFFLTFEPAEVVVLYLNPIYRKKVTEKGVKFACTLLLSSNGMFSRVAKYSTSAIVSSGIGYCVHFTPRNFFPDN